MLTLSKTLQKYRKVVVSGSIIEVYEYERMPVSCVDKDKDDYNALDILNTQIDPKERKEERRQQTVRDARNTTRRLALMNFGSGDKFITLTFKENINDIEYSDDQFKKFIKRFKYHFKIDKLNYIAVREFQKRGAIHYHLICDWNMYFESEEQIKEFERLLGEKIWKHGFVDIKQLNHVDNVGAYIIKYMTKDVYVEFFRGRKVYLCSKGLERPLVYTDYHADQIVNQYNLDVKKEVFTNSYESEYHGQIVYREFNLQRS